MTHSTHHAPLTARIPRQRSEPRTVARQAWTRAMDAGMAAYRAAHGPDLAARAEAGIAAALVIYTDHLRDVVPPVGSVPPPPPPRPLPTGGVDKDARWRAVLDVCLDRGLRKGDVAARTGRAPRGNLEDDLRDLTAVGLLRYDQGGLSPGWRTTAAGVAHLDQHARRTLTGED